LQQENDRKLAKRLMETGLVTCGSQRNLAKALAGNIPTAPPGKPSLLGRLFGRKSA